jgi:hypothetical protein
MNSSLAQPSRPSTLADKWREPAIFGENVDQRRSPRFRLRLPVLTQWTDHQGQVRYGGGFSRDISVRGVFVLSSEPPPISTMVTVTVAIPNLRADLQELQLHFVGSIVRVANVGAVAGYAIECDFSGIEDIIKKPPDA